MHGTPIKVLIVSFRFPPSNLVGAIRVGKFARYLHQRGHKVRVLTTDLAEDRSLPLEIPKADVVYTDFASAHAWLDGLIQAFRKSNRMPQGVDLSFGPQPGITPHWLWNCARRQYYGIRHIPDLRRGWTKTAIPAGMKLLDDWRPDVIFASGPPHTAFLVASQLSRSHRIPWVAEFRDLWTDNPYYSEPLWRKLVDSWLESAVLKNARALVTVSPQWADLLRIRHGKPVSVIYNGYAKEDFPKSRPARLPGDTLLIRYTGTIYPGFRDPAPLFSAIAGLPSELQKHILVEFRGDAAEVRARALTYGIPGCIAVEPRIPYRDALLAQIEADVLLLLQWNNPIDQGNLPAKLFEYLYARRPILFIGYEKGVAAGIIRERRAGIVSNSADLIRQQLCDWIDQKRQTGIRDLEATVSEGFSREEQFRALESSLIGSLC